MEKTSRLRGRPKSFDGKAASNNTIQSLENALDVLDILAISDGLTLTEISKNLSRSPSSIYRVLNTFERRGIVESDPTTQAWHIGSAAFRLGSSFLRRSGIVERSRPILRKLMEETSETANLGIARSGTVLFVSQVETHETIRAFFAPGTQSPMHASGIGKALLSRYTPERLDAFLRNYPLKRFTAHSITDEKTFRAELQDIRTRGFALDNEERTVGMRCVAAPIIDLHGEAVAGISVSGPTYRMTETQLDRISMLVCESAENLSEGLGARY